ncbi:uncharacterized protein METZ01_LOCUS311222, partial [marine metagenome]
KMKWEDGVKGAGQLTAVKEGPEFPDDHVISL